MATVHLFSQECIDLLRQALEKAEADSSATGSVCDRRNLSLITREDDFSMSDDEEEDNQDDSDSSSSSLHSQDNEETLETRNDEDVPALPVENTVNSRIPVKAPTMKRPPKTNQTQRQKKEKLLQQMGTPPLLPLPLSDTQALCISSAFLTKREQRLLSDSNSNDNNIMWCTVMLKMTTKIAVQQQPVVIFLLKSGRFAGGVFCAGQCIAHRVRCCILFSLLCWLLYITVLTHTFRLCFSCLMYVCVYVSLDMSKIHDKTRTG